MSNIAKGGTALYGAPLGILMLSASIYFATSIIDLSH